MNIVVINVLSFKKKIRKKMSIFPVTNHYVSQFQDNRAVSVIIVLNMIAFITNIILFFKTFP